jgi:S-adenosylmethionine/arginine decarboxylase-like enzyme
MEKPVYHKQVIIRARLNRFFGPEDSVAIESWVSDLIKNQRMNLLLGPYSVWVGRDSLVGWTALAGIETSHFALHHWAEYTPNLVQLDLYSCSEIDMDQVIKALEPFGINELEMFLLDREFCIKPLFMGTLEEYRASNNQRFL